MSFLKLTSAHHDPRNTLLIQPDGQALYQTKTKHSITTITRLGQGNSQAGDSVVGSLEKFLFMSDEVCLHGSKPMKMDEFLSSTGLFTNSRTFTGPDGVRYTWHRRSRSLELKDDSNGQTVATFQPKATHLFREDEKGYLMIAPGGMRILDVVVVTWIEMEKRRQASERGARTHTAAAINAQGGGIAGATSGGPC